jgi:hypothetical protein
VVKPWKILSFITFLSLVQIYTCEVTNSVAMLAVSLICQYANIPTLEDACSESLPSSVSVLVSSLNCIYLLQVWSLHALALIADSGGPMFRGYVEPSLSLALKLLLNVPQSYIDVHQCIGKVLSALITTVGPELQGR